MTAKLRRGTFAYVANDYAKRIVSGKIPACWQAKAAAQRFLNDLERDDLLFDTDRIDHVCDFAQAIPHVVGPLSGEFLRLEPFQIFLLANLFGFLERKTGLRKYREAFVLLPRGNAKSTLAAIIALYMTFCEGQGGAASFSGATSLDQASAVFSPARQMVQAVPAMREALGLQVAARSIYQESTGSSFRPVIANTKDGDIPWLCICDELHQAKNGIQLAAFRTGMGKRKGADPLLLIISTAGTNLAGVCRSEQLYFESVLNGSVNDDAKFALIYTIDPEDDWRDFRVWRKANPNYGVSIDEAHLKREFDTALVKVAAQTDSLTKYLNVWCNSASGWLNSTDWKRAAKPDLTLSTSDRCWIGVDLSTKTDLTAVVLVAELPDGKRAIVPYLFLPQGALERSPNAKAYAQWIDDGALIVTEGSASDHAAVEVKIRELCATYNVQSVVFDPWQSASISQSIAADGMEVATFAQNATTFDPVMMDFEADLLNDLLVHNDNPALNWMAANISIERKGRYRKPSKPTGQAHLKIDGMVAALMAYAESNTIPPAPTAPMLFFA